MELPVRIRAANQEDIPFVFNSWLKGYKNSKFAQVIDNNIFFHEHHKVIEKLIKHYDVLIACAVDDPSQIYGFICAGYTDGIFTLHYLYIKHTFRNMGIGKLLFNSFNHDTSTAGLFTHYVYSSQKLSEKFNMVYHPYLVYNIDRYKVKTIEQSFDTSNLSEKQ
jgi:hypothetical protein